MAAGFRGIVGWMLGWKASVVGEAAVGGPYRIVAGEIFQTGRIAGEVFHAGQAAGEIFHAGQAAGMIDGRSN